jgi:hypothetical protein
MTKHAAQPFRSVDDAPHLHDTHPLRTHHCITPSCYGLRTAHRSQKAQEQIHRLIQQLNKRIRSSLNVKTIRVLFQHHIVPYSIWPLADKLQREVITIYMDSRISFDATFKIAEMGMYGDMDELSDDEQCVPPNNVQPSPLARSTHADDPSSSASIQGRSVVEHAAAVANAINTSTIDSSTFAPTLAAHTSRSTHQHQHADYNPNNPNDRQITRSMSNQRRADSSDKEGTNTVLLYPTNNVQTHTAVHMPPPHSTVPLSRSPNNPNNPNEPATTDQLVDSSDDS